MRPLSRAREEARSIRSRSRPPLDTSMIDWVRDRVLERNVDWSVERDDTIDADALIHNARRAILYHSRNERDVATLRRVLGHELGHYVLHPRLTTCEPDPLGEFASEDLAGRTSRYDWEEADAEAFSYELLCPALEVLELWRDKDTMDVATIAALYGVSRDTVGVQLARAVADACDGSPGMGTLPPCTDAQREVAHAAVDQAVYVDAGPGTGKTRTLIERVRWLVEDCGNRAENVLVLSFSNAAVNTVRERLLVVNPDWGGRVAVATAHSLASELVRRHRKSLGYEHSPMVLDDAALNRRIQELLSEQEWPELLDLFSVSASIESLKRALDYRFLLRARQRWLIDGENAEGAGSAQRENSSELELFDSILSSRRKLADEVTFDDLLELANEALIDENVAAMWRSRYKFVLVDEAQDLGPAALRLILTLAPSSQPAWFAGDHRQRIYGFQGATPEVPRWVERHYRPAFRKCILDENHRTLAPGVPPLMGIVRAVDSNDQVFWRSTRIGGGDGLPCGVVKYEAASKDFGVALIQELVVAALKDISDSRRIVVLTRNNADAHAVVRGLRCRNIGAYVPGGLEIDGVAGDLATVLDPGLVGVVGSKIRTMLAEGREGSSAARTVDRIRELLAQSSAEPALDESSYVSANDVESAFALLVRFLFDDGGKYLRSLFCRTGNFANWNVAQVATVLLMSRGLHGRGSPVAQRRHMAQLILAKSDRAPPAEACRGGGIEAVRVMTVHQAKGREFEHVIVLLTKPQEGVGDVSEMPWSSVACTAFVAASRGMRRTEFVLVDSGRENPFEIPLRSIERVSVRTATRQPEYRGMKFAADSLWSPDARLGIDGGFWREGWCAIPAFIRATLRVRAPTQEERLQIEARRLLHERLVLLLGGVAEQIGPRFRDALPFVWAQRVERLAFQLHHALINSGVGEAKTATSCLSELESRRPFTLRFPVVGFGFVGGDCEAIVLLSFHHSRDRGGSVAEGLADATRYYVGASSCFPRRVVVLSARSGKIDEKLGSDVLRRIKDRECLSPGRASQLTVLRTGSIPASPGSFACSCCAARLLCPAYHLSEVAESRPTRAA